MDTTQLRERFNTKHSYSMGCWEWLGWRYTETGYGGFNIAPKHLGAHRMSYEIYHGQIPQGMMVRHKCDNRACVNPFHLELGTCADNMQDAVKRDRVNYGTKVHTCKLTESEVMQIVDLLKCGLFTQRGIAFKYRVSQGTVAHINKGLAWRRITENELQSMGAM